MQRKISFQGLWNSFKGIMYNLYYQERINATRIDGVITNGGLSEPIIVYGSILPLTADEKSSDEMIKINNASYSLICKTVLKKNGIVTDIKQPKNRFEIVMVKNAMNIAGFFKYYLKEYVDNRKSV